MNIKFRSFVGIPVCSSYFLIHYENLSVVSACTETVIFSDSIIINFGVTETYMM
jgi:hypothetical protein